MIYRKPELILLSTALHAIHGDLGKPFILYSDFRPIRWPAMTPGAYEADE